jgi:hypothetical protein
MSFVFLELIEYGRCENCSDLELTGDDSRLMPDSYGVKYVSSGGPKLALQLHRDTKCSLLETP